MTQCKKFQIEEEERQMTEYRNYCEECSEANELPDTFENFKHLALRIGEDKE